MVVNMIKWRTKPPLQSMQFEATIMIRCLKGLTNAITDDGPTKLMIEIKWKGSSKSNNGLRALGRKSVKRDFTGEECLRDDGVVQWDEEFTRVCGFSGYKGAVLNPWELEFIVLNASDAGQKRKAAVAGPMVLNLAEFASLEDEKEFNINVPLTLLSASADCNPSLCLLLRLVELGAGEQPRERLSLPAPLSPCFGGPVEKDEHLTFRRRLEKVKSLTEFISSRKSKKSSSGEEASSDGKFSTGSEESEYPFDTDSFNDTDEGESEGSNKVEADMQNSFGYGSLVSLNLARSDHGSGIGCEDEDRLYYSSPKPDESHVLDQDLVVAQVEQSLKQSQKLGILNWRKGKLSFKRSPKNKGEPLLKKEYGEEGGDDIDFDRRQLSSSDKLLLQCSKREEKSPTVVSEFGGDDFTVGCWELKEVVSRDGCMKLHTQVFFGSIDQRNERAAGESACTALVAVIADWIHSNQGQMPIKSDFDSLIREGSLQWRNLCDNEAYRERFPDKHFDLDTILQAKIRPLSVIHDKSFVGFFRPEGLNEEGFDFLHGAMSFDSIWDDEICQISQDGCDCAHHSQEDPLVYIVSWNDHFFILKVDRDAYYIIDTLGERLYEGCNQAYILKFDRETTIKRVPKESSRAENNQKVNSQPLPEPPSRDEEVTDNTRKPDKPESVAVVAVPTAAETNIAETGQMGKEEEEEEEEVLVCSGKESCKEYIKSFMAAIPIRELQADLKRGLMASTPLHHRLQIDFHHTKVSPPAEEEIIMAPEMLVAVEPEVEVAPPTLEYTPPEVVDVAAAAAVPAMMTVAAAS